MNRKKRKKETVGHLAHLRTIFYIDSTLPIKIYMIKKCNLEINP